MAGKIYQAREPFLANIGGVSVAIQPGTTVREGHPLLAGKEHLFEPFTVDYEYEPPSAKPTGGDPAPARSASAKPGRG